MLLVGLKSSTYINSSKKINCEDPKFKIGYIVRIPKYKNIFAKIYVPNWSKDVFAIKKLKNIESWTYVISDFNGDKTVATFSVKICKKQIRQNIDLKKY